MNRPPIPEQVVAYNMAEKIQSWTGELPKWREMPEVKQYKANFNKTVAAIQIAKAVSRLMKSTSDVLNANIDYVLGHQARTAFELCIDAAWLQMNDENGDLSEQFMTWHTLALYEINGNPGYGADVMQEARERYGDKLDKSPDEWTVIEGKRKVANPSNRREAVAAKLEKIGVEGMRGEMRKTFKMLNALSHGMTATAPGGKSVLTNYIMIACFLAIQECQAWLLEITGRIYPDEESEAVTKSLWEYATEYLSSK